MCCLELGDGDAKRDLHQVLPSVSCGKDHCLKMTVYPRQESKSTFRDKKPGPRKALE